MWLFVAPPAAALAGWALWKGLHHGAPFRGAPAPALPPAPPLLGKPPSQQGGAPNPVSADGPMAPPKPNPIQTPAGRQLILITPTAPDGKPTIAAQVATASPNKDAAHLLYDALKNKGTGDAAALRDLVLLFQQGNNADHVAKGLSGLLALTGLYDQPTAAALTIYTGDPIPPAPSTPAPPPPPPGDWTRPGPAAQSSSNLYAYLKTHKNNRTDKTLSALVKAFQHDVNTDPQFPGPAYHFPNLKIIKTKLTEDGIYGKGTSDALAVVTFERINP